MVDYLSDLILNGSTPRQIWNGEFASGAIGAVAELAASFPIIARTAIPTALPTEPVQEWGVCSSLTVSHHITLLQESGGGRYLIGSGPNDLTVLEQREGRKINLDLLISIVL
jgi:hypothetical protein